MRYVYSWFGKKINLYALGATFILFLVSFYSEKYFSVDIKSYNGYIGTKIIYLCVAYLATCFFIYLFKNRKESFFKKWFTNFFYVFIPLLAWLFFIWPGIFTWDEFWVYESATQFIIENWQSYITSYFYIISMYLFPSVGTIVFIQILFMSFVCSWLITKLELYFFIKKIKFFIFLFLALWPAIIFSTLITYRSTMLAIIELLLVSLIYFMAREKELNNKLILIGFLTVILSVWRAEGIYHIIVVPLALLFIFKMERVKIISIFTFLVILFSLFLSNIYTWVKHDEFNEMKYELTAFVNPISNILSDKNANVDNVNLDIMNKVIDLEKTKEKPYFYEIPSFWDGAVREGFTSKDLSDFKKEYVKLVLKNIDIFIAARTRTFVAASGFSSYGYYTNDYLGNYLKNKPDNKAADLMMSKILNNPTSTSLREWALKYLDYSKEKGNIVDKKIFFWDFIPLLIVLLFILIRLKSLSDPFIWMIILCVGRVPILFIAQPGSYYMYYYPMFLSGTFVIVIYCLDKIKKRKTQY